MRIADSVFDHDRISQKLCSRLWNKDTPLNYVTENPEIEEELVHRHCVLSELCLLYTSDAADE